MKRHVVFAFLACALELNAPRSASAVMIETVPVGNAGNANDPADGDNFVAGTQNFGAVNYAFNIGKYEVTNAQYAEFLNAKAKSDPLGLYNPNMAKVILQQGWLGGIVRSGAPGNYSYTIIAGRGQLPVGLINWFRAVRFANWLHNGQGNGDTETGAYTLGKLGADGNPLNSTTITRNAGAKWFLPTEDEWYKAAYHKNDGVTGNYFKHGTSSDVAPIIEAPPGGSNSANYFLFPNDLTNVGAYTGTMSPYGAFDMAGNVMEWNETLLDDRGSGRGLRGGSLWDGAEVISAAFRGGITPDQGINPDWGFRVASMATVPEPATAILGLIGMAGLAAFVKGGRRRASLQHQSSMVH